MKKLIFLIVLLIPIILLVNFIITSASPTSSTIDEVSPIQEINRIETFNYRSQHIAYLEPYIKKAEEAKKPIIELVEYSGPIEHIFFHPLIAYPELAFDGDEKSQGYYDWFVTAYEFKKILPMLYANNYVLIDIHSIYEEQIIDGKKVLSEKKLMLPKDKKPLIISVDDINYYDYMRANGNVYKLILDEKGDIATYAINPAGEEEISYDNGIIPIIETFIKEHPDFSYENSRAILALTGYEGVLGYRTQNKNAEGYEQEKAEALKVINRLKELGYVFASHGYGHLNANKISYNLLVKDTNRWKDGVETLIGKTDIYIYPFGSRIRDNQKKLDFLIDSGFSVFCSVGPAPYLKIESDNILMDRRHIDGMAFTSQRKRLLTLFDVKDVIDPIRKDIK